MAVVAAGNYRGEEDVEWNTLDAWSAGGALNLTVFGW